MKEIKTYLGILLSTMGIIGSIMTILYLGISFIEWEFINPGFEILRIWIFWSLVVSIGFVLAKNYLLKK